MDNKLVHFLASRQQRTNNGVDYGFNSDTYNGYSLPAYQNGAIRGTIDGRLTIVAVWGRWSPS